MKNNNLDELYDNLCKNNQLKSVITFSNNKITIKPFSNLVIDIVKTNYFDVYVNQTLYYSIEAEEIIDFILDFANEKLYFIEEINKNGKNKIKTLTNIEYLNKKLTPTKFSVYSINKKLQ